MVSLTSIINKVGSFVGKFTEGKRLAKKASGDIKMSWEGEARNVFDETYTEVDVDVIQVCDNYEKINTKIRSLQSSIEVEENRRREERIQQRLQQRTQRNYGR